MNTLEFEITATLHDEAVVADAAVHLGMALARVGDVSIKATEQSEALGMNRREVILSIVISFSTSVAATIATDLIKEALRNVHCSAIIHVDVFYDSAGPVQPKLASSTDDAKKPPPHTPKHSR